MTSHRNSSCYIEICAADICSPRQNCWSREVGRRRSTASMNSKILKK